MTRYSLDELRQRYVIEARPLEASLEEILRADTRAGARAILLRLKSAALKTGLKVNGFARCCVLRRFCGMRGSMRLQASTRPE